MAPRKTTKTPPDKTVYVGVLVTHLKQIVRHLEIVIDAAEEIDGRYRGGAAGGGPGAIPGTNILIDGRCHPAVPGRGDGTTRRTRTTSRTRGK